MKAACFVFLLPVAIASEAHAQDATETPPPPPPPPTTTATTPPPPPPAAPTATETIASDAHARLRVDTKIGSGLLGWVGLVPQLVVGGNFGRWSVGLGFGFVRGTLDVSSAGGGSSQVSATYVAFAPTVQFDLVRSTDDRVALYALAAVAPSLVVVDNGSGGGGTCNGGAGFVFGYQAAIGARYAFHKQFMLGVEGGPSGAFSTAVGCSTPGSANVAPGLHAMYGALVGTFLTP